MSGYSSIDETLLREVIGYEEAEIIDLEVTDFCEAGDNFASILKGAKFKAVTNGNVHNYDIVIKLAKNIASNDVDFSSLVFYKEIGFYRKLVPCFENWQKEKFGCIKYAPPAPNSLFGSFDRNILVLDNLKLHGFANANRMYGLNFQKCRFTLKALARFHAYGAAFAKDYGEDKLLKDFDFLKDNSQQFYENEDMMKMFRNMHDHTLDSIDGLLSNSYPEEVSDIKDLINYGKKHFIAENIGKYSLPNEKFNVIGHGDLWTNNILFKYDEAGSFHEIKFVDFQLMRYSTPAADLIYFIWMSGDKEVLVEKQEQLLEMYYLHLQKELEILDIELSYTFKDLKEDYFSFIDYGIMQCVKTSLYFAAKTEDSLVLKEGESVFGEEGIAKINSKTNELVNSASEHVKEKLINVVRYGKKMNLY